ncbi:MAG: acyltransferase family protein [Muribaculaceae bacterium]|nr:acyltransferase family protein [Muribaculaceae bacterium]
MLSTLLIFLLAILSLVKNCRYVRNSNEIYNVFDKSTTTLLKGFCAIIVVFVHIPQQYSNNLQDMIGSFAYVAVTFFFFASAYGMQFSLTHRPDYLRSFWMNRLSALLIPMFFVNILAFIFYFISKGSSQHTWLSLVHLNGYVKILLEYCICFYILNKLSYLYPNFGKYTDITLIIIVAISSIYTYATNDADTFSNWPFERIGLIWGLLAFRYLNKVKQWLRNRNLAKLIIFIVLSLILGIIYLKYKSIVFWGEYLLKIILGLSILTTAFLAISNVKLGNTIGKLLGEISYSIYLFHDIAIIALSQWLPTINSNELIGLLFIIVLIISWLITRLSTPVIKRIKKSKI